MAVWVKEYFGENFGGLFVCVGFDADSNVKTRDEGGREEGRSEGKRLFCTRLATGGI